MSNLISNVTDASFEQDVLNYDGVVLVDFWAPWCGPCRMLAPTLDAVAESYANKVKIVKVNVDENSATAAKYEIRGIPTLLLFKAGELLTNTTGGGLSKEQLASFLDSYL